MTERQEQRTLDIAGIRFLIRSPSDLPFHEANEAYAPFLRAAQGDASAGRAIRVELRVADLPDVHAFEKIFSAGETWTLYRAPDDTRWIVFLHGDGAPLWTAHLDRNMGDLTVFCSERMIDRRAGGPRLLNPLHYPLDQLLVMQVLSRAGGFIVHSAGALLNGRGFVFAGRCGAGKSTLTRSLSALEGVRVLSDDRCIVRPEAGGMHVYGTPWPGEAHAALNESAPLAGILFLRQAARNAVTPLDAREAAERLLPVCSIPWYEQDLLPGVLDFCGRLAASVPCHVFDFTPDRSAAECLMEFAAGTGK